MKSINFDDLNDRQRRAVRHTEGPLLIIAGPGSGKTKTLVARTLYLIAKKNIPPENIMVSTFTEKAAKELISRVSDSLVEADIRVNLNEMYIGTLHSNFLRILEENSEFTRLKKSYRLLDEFDQQYFVYKNLRNYQQIDGIDAILTKDNMSRWDKAELLLNWINKVSEEMLDNKKLQTAKDKRVKVLGFCYQQYMNDLDEENALDFSTIQSETYNLLLSKPSVLKELQQQIKYIMVDEYQDTNTIQEMILLKLAGKHQNLCVVGDDDQGLYRFRGATIRNILEFSGNFKKGSCKEIKLETNYRSHPEIIDFYSEWMNHQPEGWSENGKQFRFSKKIRSPQEKKFPQYKSVIKVSGEIGKNNWGHKVREFLVGLKKKGILTDYNQAAFLFKSVRNDKVKALADYLESKGIPVFSPRSDMFFDRQEIRLLIGAFIFMFPQYPEIRKWADNIELSVWDYYDSCFAEFAEELRKVENKELKIWAVKKANLHRSLPDNTDYAFSGLFYQLMQFPLLQKYFDIDISGGATDTRSLYNLALFSKLLTKFEYLEMIANVLIPKYLDKHLKNFFNEYMRFLIDGGISEYEDFDEYLPSGCVSFMTIHQAKGLEFPIVFVGSLNLVPRKQYTEIDELLQEKYYRKPPFEPIGKTKYYDFWRLFYTAFSRAQNLLVLTGQENVGKGMANYPSKYFRQSYQPLLIWNKNQVKIDKLKLERIKDINIKKEYSFTSHILLFENCALQYKYYKELDFAPVRRGAIIFGTLVHYTLEDIHKHAARGDTDKITTDNINDWFEQNYAALAKSERSYLAPATKKAALKQILKYVDRHSDKWDLIKDAEFDVSLVKDKYILKGTIDVIRGKDGTYEIVDFKAEDKPNLEAEDEKIQRYRRQLEVYSHLLEERTGAKVSKMHLYFTQEDSGSPYVSFDKEHISIDKTIKAFDHVVSRIENKDFTIHSRPEGQCRDCDIRFYCNTT
jgi:DNA helicase-2/ATP-dependent DNA helicase PcrA